MASRRRAGGQARNWWRRTASMRPRAAWKARWASSAVVAMAMDMGDLAMVADRPLGGRSWSGPSPEGRRTGAGASAGIAGGPADGADATRRSTDPSIYY